MITRDGSVDLRGGVARLVAGIMIAGGRVAPDDIVLVERLDYAGLGPLSSHVKDELERAARGAIDLRGACQTVRSAGKALAGAVTSMLARLVTSDDLLGSSESTVLSAIARELGVEANPAGFPAGGARIGSNADARPVTFGRRAFSNADRAALEILGLDETAALADVASAYLTLVERADPARLAPLGADFVALAVRELAALTEAYERAWAAVRAAGRQRVA